jgi:hypothetical protein
LDREGLNAPVAAIERCQRFAMVEKGINDSIALSSIPLTAARDILPI